MKSLAQIIPWTKPHNTQRALLCLLLCALPIGTTQATSLEKEQPKNQNQLLQDFLPNEYIMQNPLVALLTVSDYSKAKVSSLPLVIKDEKLLLQIFQNKYHYHTINPCSKLNYAVGRKQFEKMLINIKREIEDNHYSEEEHEKYDSLIFVYNGHGVSGYVQLSDGKNYSMAKICAKFDNRSLDFWVEKPRIIIKLACRGGETGEGISKNPNPKLQKEKMWYCEDQDFINIYANTEGKIVQQSIDTKNNKGSAFVEALNQLTNHNVVFQSNLNTILKMLGTKVRKMMQGTECLEWRTTSFSTLYLAKRTHVQHSTQQQGNTTIQDLEERKSPDEPIIKDTKQQQSNTTPQDLDDEKDPDEPIIEDTKKDKSTNKTSFDVERLKGFISTAIDKVENKETLHKLQNNDMVYFYGNTGSGKNTIINYLLGNELEKYYPEDDENNTNPQIQEDYTYASDSTDSDEEEQEEQIFKIRRKDPNAIGPSIGHRATKAETTYPCPYFPKGNDHQLGYCDTAPFSDTRGIENIVCSYIGNNLIIQKSNKLKAICFVTYKQALEIDRGQPFLNSVISTIANLVKEKKDCNPLDSIFVVLNNKSQIDNATLVATVFTMLNNFRRGFKESKQQEKDEKKAKEYESYINILKKILKDSSNEKTMRILAINPLDDGKSRKEFLQRINTSPIIPKQNLKKLASKQGETTVKYLQKETLHEANKILDTILTLTKTVNEKTKKASTLATQINNLKKDKENNQKTIKDLDSQSQQTETEQQDIDQKIINNQKQQQDIQKQIDQLGLKKISFDDNKETENFLSQYDHMIKKQQDEVSDLKSEQKDIKDEVKRLKHRIEDIHDEIDKLTLQIEKETKQIEQLKNEKEIFLQNLTQDRIVALAKDEKNWFDYYQKLLNPISDYWFDNKLEQKVFNGLKKNIYSALQACNQSCLTLTGHEDSVCSVNFNQSGTLLASASWDKTIKIWDTSTWTCIKTLKEHEELVESVHFNKLGKLLASASYKTIKIWDTSTWTCIKTLKEHSDRIFSVNFNRKGDLLASGSFDKTIKIWDTSNWTCTKTLKEHSDIVRSVHFNPSGTLLASGSWDDTIKIWNTSTWSCIKTLIGHSYPVFSVNFNQSGTLLASSSNGILKIWNTHNWSCIKTLEFYYYISNVGSVHFNPSGTLLASEGINIWDTSTWDCKKTLKNKGSKSVHFNSAGTLLASGSSDDQTIKISNIATLLGHSTSEYHIPLLDKDKFKLQTDGHLATIKEVINHYYDGKTKELKESPSQKTVKKFKEKIQSLTKELNTEKDEQLALQKQIDDIKNNIATLKTQKFEKIKKNKQLSNETQQKLAKQIQKKKDVDSIIHKLQQSQNQKKEDLNNLSKELIKAQSKHESLIDKIKREEEIYQEVSNTLKTKENELDDYQGMLERKQPEIDLILKIDSIVPLGLIALSFIKKYNQCKINSKHL